MSVLDNTHEVLNQVPPLVDYNVFEADLALREALEREGGGWGVDRARDLGAVAGSAETQEHGRRAERNEPRLLTHDRYGNRIDQVDLDPSWHWLLRVGVEREISSLPWRDPQPGAHVVRGALMSIWSQANAGVMCPISMTYSAVPALRRQPDLAQEWEPRLTLPDYERGALCGMAMTEKQGGSDVRANTTRAEPLGDGHYEITGHKWFCSYPPCDVFLVLAQAPAGLSCFLVEGRDPGFQIQRLKDKLGTRSLPSSEVEFKRLPGRLVGEEGRGVPTIIEMVNHTRLDCLLGSATGMRRAVAEAVHHARHRSAFGKLLAEQPAMQNVLADLAIEAEAATVAAFRVARAYDEQDTPFRRLATAVMKYWVCKRAAPHAAEALECLGGNGFVEESRDAAALPRRAAQLDLGGLGQRGGARRAARAGARARGAAGIPRRVRAGRRRRPQARPPSGRAEGGPGRSRPRGRPVPGALDRRADGDRPPGQPAGAQLPGRGGRRLLRRPAGGARPRLRHVAEGRGRPGDRGTRSGGLGG